MTRVVRVTVELYDGPRQLGRRGYSYPVEPVKLGGEVRTAEMLAKYVADDVEYTLEQMLEENKG